MNEKEIFDELEETLPRKVVDAISEAIEKNFDVTKKDTSDVYKEYTKIMDITQNSDSIRSTASVSIKFASIADYRTDLGLSLKISGKFSDGFNTYETEWSETPAGYVGLGEISDLVNMLENVSLSEWACKTISDFFEYGNLSFEEHKCEVSA